MDRHHDQTRSGSPASLEPSLVTILMAMQRTLGSVEATLAGNRQQMGMMQDHIDTRIDDLRREVFHRFKRTDTDIERRIKGRSIKGMVWGFVKLIPIKHTVLLVSIWLLALFGILSPAETVAAIKDLFLPAAIR